MCRCIMRRWLLRRFCFRSFLLFVIATKSNKKKLANSMGSSLRLIISYYELAKRHSFKSGTFNTVTPLRTMGRSGGAVFFTVCCFLA
jgi:hypothetical protein